MSHQVEHVANIGERGAERRRRGGFVWLTVAAIALAAMFVFHAPREARLALVLPIGFAAAGFLQAREKT